MRALPVIVALLIGSGSAQALTLTPAERRACYEDSIRLCGVKRGVEPSAFERLGIVICMVAHVGSVAPGCRAVFTAHGL
jgi:hypothetical protein